MRLAIAGLIIVLAIIFAITQTNDSEIIDNSSQNQPNINKIQHSIDDPASLWVVVNKKRPLPTSFEPKSLSSGLKPEAKKSLDKLLSAAKNDGHVLNNISAYRSYVEQEATYSSIVAGLGQEEADKQSARPSYSEHQTGLAVDLGNGTCDLEVCFGDVPAGKWLASNAHNYGFIIRYQKGKETITGYQYEPWHLRYVGFELADELYKTGQTMEEFFGLVPATNY